MKTATVRDLPTRLIRRHSAANFNPMHPFDYCVSLRLWHPNINPQKISLALAIKPRTMWKVGDDAQTPAGRKLNRKHDCTYWYARLHRKTPFNSEAKDFCEILGKTVTKLEKRRAFLESFRSTGGRIEFLVAFWGAKNFGLIIGSDLFAALGKLNIDLALDIYPHRYASR